MSAEKKITNIIDVLFHTEHRNLAGTTAEKSYEAYLKDKDLKTLKDSLEEYRDSLTGDDEMGISLSVNSIFQFINNIFVENQAGETALTDLIIAGLETKASSNLSEQSIALNKALEEVIGKKNLDNSGFLGAELAKPESLVAHANALTSTLGNGQLLEYEAGKGSFSEIIGTIETGLLNKKGTTIADAIGNSPLGDFKFAGVKTKAADSLSDQLFAFTSAAEIAIGIKPIDKTGFLGANEETPSSLVAHANLVTETLGSGQLLENDI
jgi:hypothetical protein